MSAGRKACPLWILWTVTQYEINVSCVKQPKCCVYFFFWGGAAKLTLTEMTVLIMINNMVIIIFLQAHQL